MNEPEPADIGFIPADWPAPPGVVAGTTTRRGGVSRDNYASLNLGDRSGDEAPAVRENRRRLRAALSLPNEPFWLHQVHGCAVADADSGAGPLAADAAVAAGRGSVCVVLTADCLPVLLCSRDGVRVAAAHAGWRGLAAGVLPATVAALASPAADLQAWLGPAIGPAAFEVGPEVRAAFMQRDAAHARAFIAGDRDGKFLADIYELARRELRRAGVTRIYGGGRCTWSEKETFFSYRRQGAGSGRMASLIWRR